MFLLLSFSRQCSDLQTVFLMPVSWPKDSEIEKLKQSIFSSPHFSLPYACRQDFFKSSIQFRKTEAYCHLLLLVGVFFPFYKDILEDNVCVGMDSVPSPCSQVLNSAS